MNESTRFEWRRHPDAEAYVVQHIDDLLSDMPQARDLHSALVARTGTRLVDWLDHLVVSTVEVQRRELEELGFEVEAVPAAPHDTVFQHPGAILPGIVLRRSTVAPPGRAIAAAIQVEEISRFLMMHHVAAAIQGTVLSPYRCAVAWESNGQQLLAVERRGHPGYLPVTMPDDYALRYLDASERWATRPRGFHDERAGMEQTLSLARELVVEMGRDTAAWIAFAAERAHWHGRNQAGQIQKARQDSLGLGWANHDHHALRSSRAAFPLLIEILETFGFQPRERFYAGAEAGWGAQVMEQPACRFAVFADVDLSPDEVEGDFAHRPLPPRGELGTVGLWCALHGESMLSAGLHHLAARLSFDAAAQDLAERGIEMMSPFSEFSYLRQAFTRGERWQVPNWRLDRLSAAGQLDPVQRDAFTRQGAIGSHLENIQRGEGFKGFNQQTVSDIIRRTDPRARLGAA